MARNPTTEIPIDYVPPPFPSLFWPFEPLRSPAQYLYYQDDIWRFTVFWTLLTFGAVHLVTSLWAGFMQLRSSWTRPKKRPKQMGQTFAWVWLIPLVYLVVAGIQAVVAGSIVGLILSTVYKAGYFKMSTWMPFVWGLLNVLIIILSSFSMQGGL